jgi:hypothetical protein
MIIKIFACSATKKSNMSCILGVVVKDGLNRPLVSCQRRIHGMNSAGVHVSISDTVATETSPQLTLRICIPKIYMHFPFARIV